MFDIILVPFAWVMRQFYFLFHNYGLAIILFALITKVILFPLSLKGKKSMVKMNGLAAQQQELQKKYGKDRERLNLEIQRLYEREKINPLGGCLWSLLPLPILVGLYGVLRRPLHYLMNLTGDEINALANYLTGSLSVLENQNGEITLAEALFQRFQEVVDALPGLPELASIGDKIFELDFSFLGLNLAETPQFNIFAAGLGWNTIGLFLIPVISAALSFVSMKVSMKTNNMNNSQTQNGAVAANTKTMMVMMPLISLWIGFTLPAGLGVYWIANSVFTMCQELIAGKMLKKDYEELARQQEERARREKEEEKERRRKAAETKAKAIAEGKKKVAEKKANTSPAESRVGIRAHARGRAYDPYRFSPNGPTAYSSPGEEVDEEALDRARSLKDRMDAAEKVTARQVREEEKEAARVARKERIAARQAEAEGVNKDGVEQMEAQQQEASQEAPEESTLDDNLEVNPKGEDKEV